MFPSCSFSVHCLMLSSKLTWLYFRFCLFYCMFLLATIFFICSTSWWWEIPFSRAKVQTPNLHRLYYLPGFGLYVQGKQCLHREIEVHFQLDAVSIVVLFSFWGWRLTHFLSHLVRSNFLGTKFTVYDIQLPHSRANMAKSCSTKLVNPKQVSPKVPAGNYPVAHISYELNVLGSR